MSRNRIVSFVAIAALAALAGCSDTKSTGAAETVAATDSAAPATDPPTTSTTVAPTTTPSTVAPTTVPAVPPAFLRGDGLTSYDFGTPADTVLTGIGLTVMSDTSYTFPDPGGLTFAYAAGRVVCWNDGGTAELCGYFGGAAAASLNFVGWDYDSPDRTTGRLFSAEGIGVNVLLDAIPTFPYFEGDCYGDTTIFFNDMQLYVSTNSEQYFGEYVSGTWVPTVPRPPTASVRYVSAGDLIYGEGADC